MAGPVRKQVQHPIGMGCCVRSDAKIALEKLQGVPDTVDMAALVAVAGIDTGADQTMADVITGGEGGLHVRAVVGVDIHRVAGPFLLGGLTTW